MCKQRKFLGDVYDQPVPVCANASRACSMARPLFSLKVMALVNHKTAFGLRTSPDT
jgi:hypothetical protein